MILKKLLRALGLYHPLRDLRRDLANYWNGRQAVRTWKAAGCPPPPPDCVKYRIIRAYAFKHQTPILVETGTWYGNAIFTLRRVFGEIHTIELAPELHRSAVAQFAHLKHIHPHLGDSATVLPEVAARLTQPALFWLDGHFCAGPSARAGKDTPSCEELEYLLAQPQGRHVVLIDDARLFTGADGYPTVDALRQRILESRPGAIFEVKDDIIRIAPV